MKKYLSVILCLLIALSLFGCQKEQPPFILVPDTTLPFDEPLKFSFLSGAGAWSTELLLYPDGTFTGYFHDSNMGEMGEGYKNGTVYVCEFEGRFVGFKKLSDYTYAMKLSELTPKKPIGTEWIEDNVRYVASSPYGLETEDPDDLFYFYTPETPTQNLDEDFLGWWPGRFNKPNPKTLLCYGIYNEEAETGFFTLME